MSIQVTACLNPFSGERKEFSFEQGITINEIIRNLDALNAVNTGWRVMIDDEIITDFERVPEEGQRVYIKLVPEGDNNKDSGAGMKIAGGLLTVVGAILAFTPASALGFCLIGCGVGMFAGGVVLYNTEIPSLSDREKPEQDPSIRGSRNQMRPYGKVPVLLGKRRIYADACANPYTWVDSEGAIWLHQLFCVAQKDIQIDTSTLKIDETLLKDYSATGDISRVLDQSNPDPLIQMKISYGDSTPPLYDKCVHEIQLNTVLKHQTEDEQDGSVIRTTPAKTTKINVDVFFYNGLGKYNDEGNVVSTSVELKAEYKKSSDPDSAYQLLGYFSEGSNTISGSELKTKRYAITKDNLAADSYTVKISRVTADSTDTKIIDTVYVGSIRAANNDTPVRSARCQQVTLIGLKIKASEKLNNIVEQLNFVAQSKMPVYNSQLHQWTNALTSNPASAAMYAMQGEVAQQRLSNSDIDLDSFAALYSWCANHDYECNAYITDDMTINNLLSSIASTCRAEILRMNGKITVIQDIAKDSFVQLFTPRNSHDYKETMALADIPDVLKMGIVDKTNGYAENEVPVYNTPSGNPVSGVEPQTSQSVPLWGVTDSVQARKLAMYNYAVSKHRFTVVKFSCDFEYLMCRKGDWIKYAGDIALAGLKQGRIEAVDGQKLILDEQVTMESGSSYAVRIRKSDGTAALCNVQTVVGTSNEITISGQIPSGIEGCLFAFGITGNETLDLIVTDIQCGEDLSADLTCVEYAPEIFGVDDPGFVLPDFVNKLSDVDSVVDPGDVDGWRTFATYNDSDSQPATPTGGGTSGSWHLQQTENSKWISTKTGASIYEGEWSAPMPTGKKVMDVLVPEGEIGNPDVVSGLTAVANQNEIVINWDPLGNGLKNTIKRYYIEIKRGTSAQWTAINTVKNVYYFDRETDGYPEATTLANWKIRAKAINIYGNLSDEWTEANVDVQSYGTWIIPQVVVNKEVVDRTAILTAVYGGSPRELYGTLKTLVLIKRTGNINPVEFGSQTTFNDLLEITPDSQFYTPEFNKSVQTSQNPDNEPNYKVVYPQVQTIPVSPSEGDIVQYMGADYGDFEQGKYYRYDGTEWEEFSIWFESPIYKITHTLPLIGQTARIFNGTQYTGTMTKDVEDYSTVPQTPTEGLIIHFTGEDIPGEFYNGGYYLYTNSEWVQVYSKNQMVPTSYVYQIKMTNESGNESNVAEVTVEAQCTNIADIVHSHEHYKDLYVEKLSAINANLGMISQGGMGNFEDMVNCWALSDISAEDSGVPGGVLRGTFKVGDDKEYFRVTPIVDPDYPNDPSKRRYRIELKAGNISLTSSTDEGMTFQAGTYIYNENDPNKRLWLTPTGMIAQAYENVAAQGQPPVYKWINLAKVLIDSYGNLVITNSDESLDFGYKITGSIYHFDSTETLTDEEVSKGQTAINPQNIVVSLDSVAEETKNHSPILLPSSSPSCVKGTVEKDISSFTGRMVVFSKSQKILLEENGDEIISLGTGSLAEECNDYVAEHYEDLGLDVSQINNLFK